MPQTIFFIYIIVAGSLFIFVLLWVVSRWLKADEEVEEMEKEIQELASGLESRK